MTKSPITTPPDKKFSILEKIKLAYLTWLSFAPHIPKTSKISLGNRIENKFLNLLESSYKAYFSSRELKEKYILEAIATLDLLKFLLQIAWEGKALGFGNKNFEKISLELEEIGKMLGGWKKGLSERENLRS